MPLLDIFSRKKSFDHILIGNSQLNKIGLHTARIKLSDLCLSLRRHQTFSHSPYYEHFLRDGIVAIPDFLDLETFEKLRTEALEQFSVAQKKQPFNFDNPQHGFGERRPFQNGFDRLDGGTLNRFLEIDPVNTPQSHSFAKSHELTALYRKAAGTRSHTEKFWLYQIVHGDEGSAPDIQKVLHRDTFHSAIKLWYFLEDVPLEHGPFEYVIGSHRITSKRRDWEYLKSVRTATARPPYKGGAFRAKVSDLQYMGLDQPTPFPVKRNTLVLADIRGFHRRGQALKASQRLSIYANIRPHPFSPISY